MNIDVSLFALISGGFSTIAGAILIVWNSHSNKLAVLEDRSRRTDEHIKNLYEGNDKAGARLRQVEDKHSESMVIIEKRLGEIQTSIERKLK
ncbi:MAG: hypothetical protein JWO03_2242 [Bacteroidetes bacterium]|nr:hypothetical protein [Bacteroidota bacterium]